MIRNDVTTIGSISQDMYIVSSRVHIDRSNASRKLKQKEIHFPFGAKIELDHFQQEVGGGASNAAATFKLFGLRTSIISQCGDDPAGTFILSGLKKMQIDVASIQRIPGGKSAQSVIFLDAHGERTVFVFRGVASHFSNHQVKQVATSQAKWLYVSSVGGYVPLLQAIAKAKNTHGTNVAWNPGLAELAMKPSMVKKMLKVADVVLVNQAEARMLFGELDLQKAKKLVGGALVITKGEQGSEVFVGSKRIRISVQPVKAKDTTGAGDAFGSGFVAGLFTYPGDFVKAGLVASANAMSEVLEIGAKRGLIGPKIVKKFARKISIL